MKIFLRFVHKEFLHIVRDRLTLVMILIMPLVMTVAFGYALTTDIKDVRVAVAAPANTTFAQNLMGKIEASAQMHLVSFTMPGPQAEALLKESKADAVIVLPARFEENVLAGTRPSVQLRIDAMDSGSAMRMSGLLQALLYQAVADYFSTLSLLSAADVPPDLLPYGVQVNSIPLYNPQMKAAYYFVPGVMGLILMIVCAMMTSVSIVREKEYGSIELLLTSPTHPATILVAKAVPYFLISVLNIVGILVVAHFVLGVPVRGSLLIVAVLSFFFILVSLFLGLLISTLTSDQTVAMLISGAGLMLPVSMLSGMFFPVESMPAALSWISYVIPNRWFVDALMKVIIQGAGWEQVWQQTLILAAMCLALGVIAVKSFKLKID